MSTLSTPPVANSDRALNRPPRSFENGAGGCWACQVRPPSSVRSRPSPDSTHPLVTPVRAWSKMASVAEDVAVVLVEEATVVVEVDTVAGVVGRGAACSDRLEQALLTPSSITSEQPTTT